MSVWTVGEVRITKILESEAPLPLTLMFPAATEAEFAAIPWLAPHFVDAKGRPVLSIHALVVETPTLKIVVDTCVGNDKQGRGLPNWNNLQTSFMQDFRAAGFDPDEIDLVLCTHLHADHVGWNTHLVDGEWRPTFPKARHLIDRREFEHWRADEGEGTQAMMADSLQPIFDAGLVDLVDAGAGYRICEEVMLTPTPGHTPGHVSVEIVSDGERALITGDFMHHPCQIARPDWNAVSDSIPVLGQQTRRDALAACAADGRLVIGTHFPTPTAGRIRPQDETYRFEV
jgi:glyoxylase-like metal-dependent hydrolase (beta-lactamase superfamily II)